MGWPQILSDLINIISNTDGGVTQQAQEGAMSALLKICEDHRKALDKEYQGQRPLSFVFPKLLELTTSPNSRVRADAIAAINIFIPDKLQVVLANIDPLMQQLFLMASDSSEDVRRMRDGEMERFVRDYEEGPIGKGTRQGLRSQLRCRGGSTSRCRNVNRLPSRPTLQSRCTRRGRPDRCTYLNPD